MYKSYVLAMDDSERSKEGKVDRRGMRSLSPFQARIQIQRTDHPETPSTYTKIVSPMVTGYPLVRHDLTKVFVQLPPRALLSCEKSGASLLHIVLHDYGYQQRDDENSTQEFVDQEKGIKS